MKCLVTVSNGAVDACSFQIHLPLVLTAMLVVEAVELVEVVGGGEGGR